MFFKGLLASLIVALHLSAVHVLAQTSCATYCSNYDQTLVNCRDLDSSGVDGSGSISPQAVNCMCVGTESFTGFYEVSQCYKCALLTGNQQLLAQYWVITCLTNEQSGATLAAECWDVLLETGGGSPCAGASASGSAVPSASGSAVASPSGSAVLSTSGSAAASTSGSAAAPTSTAPTKSSADHVHAPQVALYIGLLVLSTVM